MATEFMQDQEEESTGSRPQGDGNTLFNSKGTKSKEQTTAPRRPLPKWLTYLWDANISPFSIVRWAGPLGPRFTSGWTSRRFSHLPAEESEVLHNYAYSLFRQRGSGEYALAYILAPGAFARSPLIRRIQGVGRQYIAPDPRTPDAPKKRETGYPIIMMYGEHDWMDIAGGYAAEQKIKEEKARVLATATKEETDKENGLAKVVVIRRAGHHVYLEGWEQFNEIMREEMADTSRTTKRLSGS